MTGMVDGQNTGSTTWDVGLAFNVAFNELLKQYFGEAATEVVYCVGEMCRHLSIVVGHR